MNFILLTAGIMVISILLIDRLCHYAGIGLKRSSLVLCAVMAFVINGAVIFLSPFLDRAHYLRLAGLVILAAGAVTLFNERLLRRDEARAQAATGQTAPAAASAETVAATEKPAAPEPSAEPVTKPAPPKAAEPAAAKPVAAPAAKPHAEPVLAAVTAKTESVKPAAKPQPKPASVRLPQPTATVRTQVAAAHNLDDLLDLAYADAKPGNVIYIYQQAIAQYGDDPYLPFLVIELANTYKDCAAYDEAVTAYEQALQRPQIAENAAVATKFRETLRYLHSVQITLAKHHATATRFRDIPEPLMQEIETAFQQDGANKS